MPTTVTKTVKSSGGDYTSLSAWEAGEQADLVALDQIRQAECYSMADTTAFTISGWTSDLTRYIRIFTPLSERHDGKYNTSKFRIEWTGSASPANGGIVSIIGNDYVRIEGVQIKSTPLADFDHRGVTLGDGNFTAANAWISHCIFTMDHSQAGGSWRYRAIVGNGINGGGTAVTYIYNNLFHGLGDGGYSGTIAGVFYDKRTVYFYNNTYSGDATVYTNSMSVIYGQSAYGAISPTLIAKNNLTVNMRLISDAGVGFSTSTFAAGTNHNAIDDTSLGYTVTGGGNANDRLSQTFSFVDAAAKDFDLLLSDAGAKGFGVNLSADADLAFTTDIKGRTRGATWDIGAFQISPAVTGSPLTAADNAKLAFIEWGLPWEPGLPRPA